MAIDSTGSAPATRGTCTGVPLGAKLSPVIVSPSLATAARSPAGTSGTSMCSLPRRVKRAWSFSSVWVLALVRTVSGLIVPDRTLKIDTFPT